MNMNDKWIKMIEFHTRFYDASNIEYIPTNYLTYDDVLLLPNHSEIKSRQDINPISCHYPVRRQNFNPIIPSNMDTISGVEMVARTWKNGGVGILHRFWESDSIYQKMIVDTFLKTDGRVGFSVGVNGNQTAEWCVGVVDELMKQSCKDKTIFICLDVAHADSSLAVDKIKKLKSVFDDNDYVSLIAGNVATPEGFWNLVEAGADIIKCGIGGGCFTSGTKISMQDGVKNIEDICIGDIVKTHTGEYKEVINTFQKKSDELVEIKLSDSDITLKCTTNHEIYVIHEKFYDVVTDDNYMEYAEWIPSSKLTCDYFLINLES